MPLSDFSTQDRLILPLSETHALILNRICSDDSFRVSVNEKTDGVSRRVTIVLSPEQAKAVADFINGTYQVSGEIGT